jgi:hypothetical protein
VVVEIGISAVGAEKDAGRIEERERCDEREKPRECGFHLCPPWCRLIALTDEAEITGYRMVASCA